MSKLQMKLLGGLCAWIFVLGLGFHFLFQTTPKLSAEQNVALYDQTEDYSEGSLGVDRRAELMADTKIYLSQHKGEAAPAVVQGKELAPAEFLNEKLAEHGLKWRVSKVNGMDAEIFEVS